MRIPTLCFSILVACLIVTVRLHAQVPDPGADQDAEAAREKLLKASDQLDNIQANSESTKMSVDGLKSSVTKLQADIAKLQAENAALKQQVADMQTAFDQAQAANDKKEKVLLDTVAGMIAANKGATKTSSKKKEKEVVSSTDTAGTPPPKPKTPDADTGTAAPTTGGDSTSAPASTGTDADSAPVKSQKGYYHIVESGETLTLISNAYRQNGVNVTVSAIRKANGLTDKSVLKVGQKLFIPKPGT